MAIKQYTLEDFAAFSYEIMHRLDSLEKLIAAKELPKEDMISRQELMKRLNMSAPTIIKMEKKGLPHSRKGSRAFYDYNAVKTFLEK